MSIDPNKPLYKTTADGAQLPAVDAGGELRVLGCLQPRRMMFASPLEESRAFGRYLDAPLRECDWRHLAGPVLDQDGLGGCVGWSGDSAFTQAWNSAGLSPMAFSPEFAYACVNGGRDGGAVLSDMIASMASNGMAPAGSVPAYTYKMSKIPQSVRDAAKAYKAAKYYATNTYQAICQAVNLGLACSYGITIGGQFTNLDAGGVSGFGFPRGGHALHAVGLTKVKAGRYAGQWGLITKNSWTTSFGDQGYCIVVEDHFDRSVDAYAIVVPEDDSPNAEPPTPVFA